MSKSLGNFFLVSDVAKKYDPMVIRLFLLSSHYRKSINYSLDTMDQAEKNYEKIISTIQKIKNLKLHEVELEDFNDLINRIEIGKENIINAMDDDFNTPLVIAEIMTLLRYLNRTLLEEEKPINTGFKTKFTEFIDTIDKILGIFPRAEILKMKINMEMQKEKDFMINSLIDILKDTRLKLREKKLYDISDDIRVKLRDLGVRIDDK